jgi:general stress protein 26
MSKYENAIKLMNERFGKDNPISIATMDGKRPAVRTVDGYYEEGAFYVVTYTLSSKMKQIEANPNVAVCSIEWFNGDGIGENLGWVKEEKNAVMMAKLRNVFASWYSNGHVNEDDKNTCLLRIRLGKGVITDHDKKYGDWLYVVDFENKTVE